MSIKYSLPTDVIEIAQILKRHGFLGYVVGGAVRDLILGIPTSDWDFSTDARPEDLLALFPKGILTGIHHGTITLIFRGSQYEVTSFRADGDHGSQCPLKEPHLIRNIEEDLRHRDFTINAMAYDPLSKTLIDPYGGLKDLRLRIIRGVEDPLSRFLEDGLRTYRAVRFSVTLDYRIEKRTLKAIPRVLGRAKEASWERVRDEILKILEARKPSAAFEVMRKTGLLAISLPELLEGYRVKQGSASDVYHHLLATVDAAPGRSLLRLACLLHDIGKPQTRKRRLGGGWIFECHERASARMAEAVARRLRLSNFQRRYIVFLIENHGLNPHELAEGPAMRRFLSGVDIRFLDDLLALRKADKIASGADPTEIQELERCGERMREVLASGVPLNISQLAIDGDKVKEILGVHQGAQVGRVLSQAMEAVLEDPTRNNPLDLARLVENMGRR